MKKIIIISDYDEEILSILNHFRTKHVPNPCDTLSDKLIEDIFSGSIYNLKKYIYNKESNSIDEDNRKLLDIINNQRYDSIMELALRDIAKNIDNDYLGHIKDCKEVWCLTGKYYIPRQVTNNEDLYTKCSLFRTKEDAEKGREHLLDYARILSTM